MQARHVRPGFTLIELLIVMGLAVFFAGLTAVVSAPAIRNAEFDKVRQIVRNELVTARADTVSGTLDSAWGVKFTSNSVTRFRGASYVTRNTDYDRVTTLDNGVTLSGTTEVNFTRPTGSPGASATIVMTNGMLNATATVSGLGVITVR